MRSDESASVRKGPGLQQTGGQTPVPLTDEQQQRRLIEGRAWDDFCEALKLAGRHMLDSSLPMAPIDYADVFKYLTGLTNIGMRQAFDHTDPAVPKWITYPDSTGAWGAENADNRYLRARLDPAKTYRLTGNRGDCLEILFELSQGYMQLGKLDTYATNSLADFEVAPDGSIEIVISAQQQPGNWLPMHPETGFLTIREYYYQWDNATPARFFLTQVGNEGNPPRRQEACDVARQLDDAANWIATTALYWTKWSEELEQQYRPGQFGQAEFYAGGAKDILYGNNYYKLGADEALIIEATPPAARYWHFQLLNNAFVCMDYANQQTSLNGAQIHVDGDGKFRLVIAHRDPGAANWLDTGGRLTGMVQFRWVWSRDNPAVTATTVAFDQIKTRLPADTLYITPAQRRAVIASRQRHIQEREARG